MAIVQYSKCISNIDLCMPKDENFVNAGKRKYMFTYYAQLQRNRFLFYIPKAYLIQFTYCCWFLNCSVQTLRTNPLQGHWKGWGHLVGALKIETCLLCLGTEIVDSFIVFRMSFKQSAWKDASRKPTSKPLVTSARYTYTVQDARNYRLHLTAYFITVGF
jgi:hypothetical protein